MKFEKHPAGWIAHRPGLTLFFGNRNSSIQDLRGFFPQYRFLRTKQIHGKIIIPQNENATDYEVEADGSWTNNPGIALCSISADCVPILITAPGFAMALHAGWRGVASRILVEGLNLAVAKGHGPDSLQLWIGPHIRKESFVVRADARDLLSRSTQLSGDKFTETTGEDQFRIDLEMILRAQASELGIKDSRIETFARDTFTDGDLHSHRRDREKAGRQISFIVLESET